MPREGDHGAIGVTRCPQGHLGHLCPGVVAAAEDPGVSRPFTGRWDRWP